MGVESESVAKTLQFEGVRSKGIEPIVFDREDVNDFAKLVYRSKEILRDLNRPLLGVVVNLIDDPKVSTSSAAALSNNVGIKSIDAAYKSYIKPTLRAIEACTDVMLEQNRIGGRIVLLYPSNFNEKHKGVKSIVGKMLDQTANEMRYSFHYNNRNLSVSTVASLGNVNKKASSSSLYPKGMWAMDKDLEHSEAKSSSKIYPIDPGIESTLNALQHAMLSSHPQSTYNKGNMMINLKEIIDKKGGMGKGASTIIDSVSSWVFHILLFLLGDQQGNIRVSRFVYTLLTEELS